MCAGRANFSEGCLCSIVHVVAQHEIEYMIVYRCPVNALATHVIVYFFGNSFAIC